MDVKPVSGKSCYFMKGKNRRSLIVCFFLVFQLNVGAQAFYPRITKESFSKILEVDTMDSCGNYAPLILSIGLALVVSIAIISFVILLLVSLHRNDTRLILISLAIFSIILNVTFVISTVSELNNPDFTINRLPHIGNAFLMCLFTNCLVFFEVSNWLHEDA